MDSIFPKFVVESISKAGEIMIDKTTRKSPSGVCRETYHGQKCTLSVAGYPDMLMPGKIEHEEELLYAPTAVVVFNKESACWQMNLSLPKVPISPDVWPRVKSATEDVLEFWKEVRGELSDDGQWWSEADAP